MFMMIYTVTALSSIIKPIKFHRKMLQGWKSKYSNMKGTHYHKECLNAMALDDKNDPSLVPIISEWKMIEKVLVIYYSSLRRQKNSGIRKRFQQLTWYQRSWYQQEKQRIWNRLRESNHASEAEWEVPQAWAQQLCCCICQHLRSKTQKKAFISRFTACNPAIKSLNQSADDLGITTNETAPTSSSAPTENSRTSLDKLKQQFSSKSIRPAATLTTFE